MGRVTKLINIFNLNESFSPELLISYKYIYYISPSVCIDTCLFEQLTVFNVVICHFETCSIHYA